MQEATEKRIAEVPPPAAKEPGWYPDPLGSTAERYWDRTWLELTRVPQRRLAIPTEAVQNGHHPKRRLLSLVGLKHEPPAEPEPSGAGSKAERRRRKEVEERKREFFASPAGRARLSYGQKHDVFQCALPLTRPE